MIICFNACPAKFLSDKYKIHIFSSKVHREIELENLILIFNHLKYIYIYYGFDRVGDIYKPMIKIQF